MNLFERLFGNLTRECSKWMLVCRDWVISISHHREEKGLRLAACCSHESGQFPFCDQGCWAHRHDERYETSWSSFSQRNFTVPTSAYQSLSVSGECLGILPGSLNLDVPLERRKKTKTEARDTSDNVCCICLFASMHPKTTLLLQFV